MKQARSLQFFLSMIVSCYIYFTDWLLAALLEIILADSLLTIIWPFFLSLTALRTIPATYFNWREIFSKYSFNKHQFQELKLDCFSEYEKLMKRETKIFLGKDGKDSTGINQYNRNLNQKFQIQKWVYCFIENLGLVKNIRILAK